MTERRRFRGLRERLLVAVAVMIVVQFAAVLGLQGWLVRDVRTTVTEGWLHSLDRGGGMENCAQRPGPQDDLGGLARSWPLDLERRPVGVGAPVEAIPFALPSPGSSRAFTVDGVEVVVWSAESETCAGLLVVPNSRFPVMTNDSVDLALLAALRLLIAAAAAVAVVAVVAVPLVRRTREVAAATEAIVGADFQGTIPHTGPGDELDDLTDAFNAAAEAARERLAALNHRDALMRRGLSDLAHDLRTPLATLKVTVGALDPAAESTAAMRLELEYLDGLVRNFDALLRLGRPQDPASEGDVDLGALVERLGVRFGALASDRSVTLATAPPDGLLQVRGDGIALEQAAGNLVQNAVRWATGNVAVLAFRRGDEAVLEVRDDGPGIAPDEVPRLAERRTRGEGAGSRGEGFGLGLAIADEAARRHGGTLDLERLPEGGTRAAIVLPRLVG